MDPQRQKNLWKLMVAAYRTRSHQEQVYMPVDELIRAVWLFASTKEVFELLQVAFADGRIRCNSPKERFAFTVLEDNPVG